MRATLKKISSVDDAILAMYFTKRSYTNDLDVTIRKRIHDITDCNGFFKTITASEYPDYIVEEYEKIHKELEKLAKYGAGVGSKNAMLEEGHDTLLRFVDFTIVVTDLHRGAMDDLDSHAQRMCNRIVRTSTRIEPSKGNEAKNTQLSDWYKDRVIPYSELRNTDKLIIVRDGVSFTEVPPYGYIRVDEFDENRGYSLQDVIRGLIPLGVPMSCIFKVDLYNMRHIYKRRNKYTHAAPELKMAIEQVADQIEDKLPVIGQLVRNEWCDDGKLHHVMKVSKHYVGD